MPRSLAHILNVLVAAIALAAIPPAFAQTKPPSLVGQTRDQVVAQLGDPKSNIKAGAREMLFFDHVKVTLRNNVVIETETIADEPPPAPKQAPAPAAGAAPASGAAPATATPAPTPAPAPAPPQINPEGGIMAVPVPAPVPVAPAAATTDAAAKAPPPKPPEPVLLIKSIKSGGTAAKSGARPTPPAAGSTASAPVASSAAAIAPKAEPKPATPAVADAKPATVVATTPAPAPVKVEVREEPATVAETETPAAEEAPAKPAVDAKKKAAVRRRWRLRRDTETEEEGVIYIPLQSYIIGAVTIAAGIGFLMWRRNQRNLELAATAVSHSPFVASMTGATDTAGTFTAEMIGKLGQKKFERLVASYYAKTGVVAERTNAAPDAPVHIKIFWKGEPKPFAGVQCHANPPMLIGPKPLQDLAAALTAADIRRGYVVTSGKFNVEARDVGEEKHFTLLSGDIFLEKLNALPPAARGELLKETATEEPAAPVTGMAT